MSHTFKSNNEKETIAFAAKLTAFLSPGDILCLNGNLGAGKTTFVKGVAKALRIAQNKVNSPTFVLLNIYAGKMSVYHFDLYRLDNESAIEGIGLDEFLYAQGISVIEWAEKLGSLMPSEYLEISFKHVNEHSRDITLKAVGAHYKKLIKKLKI